jgi:hypothetical protein
MARAELHAPIDERMARYTDWSRGETACWEWTGSKDRKGYGRLGIAGIPELAHRIAYRLHRGEIPEGAHVCHHCDNPSCVNPMHLFVGTNADNMRDMVEKGRQSHPVGEQHPQAKVTAAQVVEIRERYSQGERPIRLAQEYGIAACTVNNIAAGRSWKSVVS